MEKRNEATGLHMFPAKPAPKHPVASKVLVTVALGAIAVLLFKQGS